MKNCFPDGFSIQTDQHPRVLSLTGSVSRKKLSFIGQNTGFKPHFSLKPTPFGLFLIMNELKRVRNALKLVRNEVLLVRNKPKLVIIEALVTINIKIIVINGEFMIHSEAERVSNESTFVINEPLMTSSDVLWIKKTGFSSRFDMHFIRSALLFDVAGRAGADLYSAPFSKGFITLQRQQNVLIFR